MSAVHCQGLVELKLHSSLQPKQFSKKSIQSAAGYRAKMGEA